MRPTLIGIAIAKVTSFDRSGAGVMLRDVSGDMQLVLTPPEEP